MAEPFLHFPLNFFEKQPLEVNFSNLDLSSDAGVLLVRQAEEQLKICEGMADCLTDNREQSQVKHSLNQLISQPTMSRLENQVTKRDIKEIRSFFLNQFLQSYPKQSEEIVLDIDGWDALTHGNQQLSLFHGYYGHYIYFPVLINEASSGYPLVLQLRAGNSHPGKGVAGILRWLFWRSPFAREISLIAQRLSGGFQLIFS